MNLSRNTSILLLFFLITACSTSKFDFKTAYKFSHNNYQPVPKPPATLEPLASTTPMLIPREHVPSDWSIRERYAEAAAAKFAQQYQQASKQERKAMRKEIRQKLKQARKEVRISQYDDPQKTIYFNQKMFIGLVLFAAGVVIAILASGGLGALVIVVGVGLIAWGLIEQA